MIVCSCNVLSDSAIRTACHAARPRTTGEVYGCLGCSPQCGRCARTIKTILDQARGGTCASGCTVCPMGTHQTAADRIAGHIPAESA